MLACLGLHEKDSEHIKELAHAMQVKMHLLLLLLLPSCLQRTYSTTANLCPAECTRKFPHNITLVSSAYHMHTLGRRIITRRVKNGQELRPLNERRFYDFGYQVRDVLYAKWLPCHAFTCSTWAIRPDMQIYPMSYPAVGIKQSALSAARCPNTPQHAVHG